jgi:hypothetical protein
MIVDDTFVSENTGLPLVPLNVSLPSGALYTTIPKENSPLDRNGGFSDRTDANRQCRLTAEFGMSVLKQAIIMSSNEASVSFAQAREAQPEHYR